MNRLFKHNKLTIFKELQIVDLLPKYPGNLTDDEKYHVESFARSTLNMIIQQREFPDALAWPKYFWNHNYDLLPCRPVERQIVGGVPVTASDAESLTNRLRENATATRQYLDQLRLKLRINLYDPRRDEVLFGLFAKLTRLYVLMAGEPIFWARDVSGIMLRPLAETAVTFSYLTKVGTMDDYKRFVEYGEGQHKLLMLHFQDNYPDQRSLDGLTSEQVADEIEMWPEIAEIELGLVQERCKETSARGRS
ncbi:MAG TPA: DUF5677 domain-containing protein [Verrucomicrobiae bacterium]|nr:DUF5677 domain-containing protein [Verrucomicrobiae bacterium]